MNGIRLSHHATERAKQMGLTITEIDAVANQPDLTYPADDRHGPERRMHQHGRLSSVHGVDGTVITFLWSGKATDYQPWTHRPFGEARSNHPESIYPDLFPKLPESFDRPGWAVVSNNRTARPNADLERLKSENVTASPRTLV